MPLLHDATEGLDANIATKQSPDKHEYSPTMRADMRRLSDESIRTEFLEGPIPDEPEHDTSPTQTELAAMTDSNLGISDRAELIERIKRGESPTWVPNRTVCA